MAYLRLYADLLDGPDIQLLPAGAFRTLVNLWCVAKKHGTIPGDFRTLAFYLRSPEQRVRKHLQALMDTGLIGRAGDDYKPLDCAGWKLYSEDRPPGNAWAEIRTRIFERDDYTCAYCGERGGKLECDHIVPVSRGGQHDDDNLTTACFACNRSKRDKTLEEWKGASGTHPRN